LDQRASATQTTPASTIEAPASRGRSLAEPEAPDQGREEDGELAPRHDVADLRETEGEEHEQVAREVHRRGDGDRAPVLPPLAGEGQPVAHHRRCEERAHAEPHEGDVRERVEAGDAGLVDDRVRRDEEPRQESPRRPGAARPRAPTAPPADREVEARDTGDDQSHAHGSERRESLAEDHQRGHWHQRHAEAARDRVDA